MIKIYPFFIVLSIILLYSCSIDDSNIEGLELESQRLVIFSELRMDQPIELYVSTPISRSDVVLDFDNQVIRNASVLLYQNNELLEELKYNEELKRYASNNTPIAGNTYSFQVTHLDYPMLQSEPVILPEIKDIPKIDTVRLQSQSKGLCSSSDLKCIDFKISLSTEEKYYAAGVVNFCSAQFGLEGGECQIDQDIGGIISATSSIVGNVFSDGCFSGNEGSIEVCGNYFGDNTFQLEFILIYISESYYLWIQSLQDVRAISEGFVEPKTTYSNINGGYGIVIARNEFIITF